MKLWPAQWDLRLGLTSKSPIFFVRELLSSLLTRSAYDQIWFGILINAFKMTKKVKHHKHGNDANLIKKYRKSFYRNFFCLSLLKDWLLRTDHVEFLNVNPKANFKLDNFCNDNITWIWGRNWQQGTNIFNFSLKIMSRLLIIHNFINKTHQRENMSVLWVGM